MKTSIKKSRRIVMKGLVVVMALSLLIQPFLIFGSASDNEQSYSTEIMSVKGGKDAIATFTVDDGYNPNDLAVSALFGQYGMPVSLMVVPERVLDTGKYANFSTVEQLRELAASGLIDIQSHSYTHMYMAAPGHADYKEGNSNEVNRYREIVQSKQFILENFPNIDPVAFAVPGGSYDEPSFELVMKTYYASRAESGIATGTYQVLTPADTAEAGGWYNLRTLWLRNDVNEIKSYLDICVANGGWFLAGTHSIIEGGPNYDITSENLALVLDSVKEYSDEGKLWVASFADAVKYLREVENSTVKQYTTDFGMYVEVNMADATEGGLPLSRDIFDMPLTVKVEIPEGWSKVRFSQKGVHTTADTFTEGGKTFAYAEIVPNSGAVLVTDVNDELSLRTANATLTDAPNGATAIATLTFDDGLVQTATKLNELCAEYGVKASLMLISQNDRTTANVDFWNALLADGNLSAEGHGRYHDYIGGNPNYYPGYQGGYRPEDETIENINDEILGSLADLREMFPTQDVLGYTVPSSNYIANAYKVLYQNYYAALGGECVLTIPGNEGRRQLLDPYTSDPTTGSYKAGSWHQLYYVRLQPEAPRNNPAAYPQLTMENIIGYLDQCVNEGGWFITSAHGMYEDGYIDYTEEDLRQLMSRISEHQNGGKLWSATFSDATKYIRERQNSTIAVTTYGDGIYYANLTMADKTAEGLPLNVLVDMPDGSKRQIFDMPLTVKVEVPTGWSKIAYSQAGGDEQLADTFTVGDKTYAYINLVPNGGEAVFYAAVGGSLEGAVPEAPAGSYTQPKGTFVPTDVNVTYAAWANEKSFLDGNAPLKQFTSTTLLNTDIAGYGYIHVYRDLESSDKIYPTVNLVINLGGKSITTPTGNKIENGLTLTIKNGTWFNGTGNPNETGQIQIRPNCSHIIENVHLINRGQWVGYGTKSNLFLFKDSKLEINGQNSYFHLVANDVSDVVSELKFINTDIIVGGSISKDEGLFSIKKSAGTAKWKITLDRNSTLQGKVDNWVSCSESAGQAFRYQQQIFIEEGFTCSADAKPTFTYIKTTLNSDNQTTTTNNSAPANDAILKMSVVYPGTEYALLGELTYTDIGGMYTLTVPDGAIDAPVGYYITPEGAWTPKGTGVTYAIWDKESDYLAGKAPRAQFTSTTLDCEALKAGGYVHLFASVTANDKVLSPGGVMLTVNLAGHTLTANNGFGTDYSSFGLTVCNGIVYNGGQTNLKDGNVLFDNLHIYQNKYDLSWGAVADTWTYRDCILEINSHDSYYLLGGNELSQNSCLKFENTDIKVNGSISSQFGLFAITPEYRGIYNYTIIFDGKSSIIGNVPVLVSCLGEDGKFAGVQTVIIEEGFTASQGAVPNFKYIKAPMRDYTAGTESVLDANDTLCNMFVSARGEVTPTQKEYSFVKNGELYTLTLATDEPDEPDEPVNPGAWAPAANTTYAVWPSLEAFERGDAPTAEYTGNISVANLKSAGVGYVQVYKNIASADWWHIETGDKIIIDLGGTTFTSTHGIEIYGGTELTIQNGNLNHEDGQIYFNTVSKMTYRNLVINVTYGQTITYGYGCTELVYDGCTVTLNKSNNYFQLGSTSNSSPCSLKIFGTQFIVNTNLSDYFFKFSENGYDNIDANWEIIIDGASSITGTGSMPGLVGLYEYYAYNGGDRYGKFENTQVIRIGEGFKISKNLVASVAVYTVIEVDYEASSAAHSAIFKNASTLLANDDRCKIYIGDTLASGAPLYANPDASSELYSFSYSMDKENVSWYRVNAEGLYVGTRAKKNANGVAEFSAQDFNTFNKGETIYFAQDVITVDKIETSNKNRTDITFDLGGNKLIIEGGRITFALYSAQTLQYEYLSYTFKNGTIDANIKQSFYGSGHKDAVFTFDNITLNYNYDGGESNARLLDVYAGTFVIKNSTVNATQGCATFFQLGNNYHAVKIENSTINAQYAIGMYQNAQMRLDYDNFYIKNSVLNCEVAVLLVENDASTQDSFMNLDIVGSKINAPAVLYVDSNAPLGKANVRLSDCYLTNAPKISFSNTIGDNTAQFAVIANTKERVMQVEGVEAYSYYVGKAPIEDGDFEANLTLFTDFNLNFFAKPGVITAVYMNGSPMTAQEYMGLNKYSVTGIAPNAAAEAIEFTVWVVKDGVTYKVPLTYSVYEYAKQVINDAALSSSHQLVLSAVKYIQAAYEYCGKAVPEFDSNGVSIVPQDTTAEAVTSLTAAVRSVQLNLKESAYIRFNLKSEYTGTLKINGVSYNVKAGLVGELDYVEVKIRASALTDSIIVEADGVPVKYDLKNYRNSEKVLADENLGNLVDALYTYGYYAKQYKQNNSTND